MKIKVSLIIILISLLFGIGFLLYLGGLDAKRIPFDAQDVEDQSKGSQTENGLGAEETDAEAETEAKAEAETEVEIDSETDVETGAEIDIETGTGANTNAETESDMEVETLIFKIEEIDDTLFKVINGKSFKPNPDIEVTELRLLTLTYYGFDDQTHVGELIVNERVSQEVLEIFRALYEAHYPIEKINLIDVYDADDARSMADNNTSAFNYRKVSGSSNLSLHSYGLAIDINPVQNPYITSRGVEPSEGEAYVDRTLVQKGMILEGDLCYELFIQNGWQWGGDFNTVKDYQHFQKK